MRRGYWRRRCSPPLHDGKCDDSHPLMKGMMRWQSGKAFTMPLAHEARVDQADADELRLAGAGSLDLAHECGWTGKTRASVTA